MKYTALQIILVLQTHVFILRLWGEWWLLVLFKSARHADINRFQLVPSHFFTGGLLHPWNFLLKLPVGFQSAQGDQGQGVRKELHPFTAKHRELPTVCISLATLSRSGGGCCEWSWMELDVCISVYTNTFVFFQLLKIFLQWHLFCHDCSLLQGYHKNWAFTRITE